MNKITLAMDNYNKVHNYTFNLIDAFVLDTVVSNSYKTDAHLAQQALCSERTIKRSINKLCICGILEKHLAYNNTKSLILNKKAYNNLLNYKGSIPNV